MTDKARFSDKAGRAEVRARGAENPCVAGIIHADIKGLAAARREGGRIIVVSIPQLNEAPRLTSEVSDRIAAMFGNGIR